MHILIISKKEKKIFNIILNVITSSLGKILTFLSPEVMRKWAGHVEGHHVNCMQVSMGNKKTNKTENKNEKMKFPLTAK